MITANKLYNQSEVSKITGFSQSTLSDISRRLELGRVENNRRFYNDSEIQMLKTKKYKDHFELLDIIKKKQPIHIKKLVKVSPFSKKKTLNILTEITGTFSDDPIDTNIWEDHEEKIYYGTSHYKQPFWENY